MAAPTMQDVLDRARIPLNDDDKIRYLDEPGLAFANTAIARAYQLRPDLAFGSYGTAFEPITAEQPFPLPYQYLQAVADYVSGRWQTIDIEANAAERAVAFMAGFESAILN